jgi:hypothetical protein
MPEQRDQTNAEWKPKNMEDWDYDKEELHDIMHKAELTLCYVKGNDLGDRVYGIYIEDEEGLKKPIGVEMIVNVEDRSVSFLVGGGLGVLYYLKPELFDQPELLEQLKHEDEEVFWQKREPGHHSNA